MFYRKTEEPITTFRHLFLLFHMSTNDGAEGGTPLVDEGKVVDAAFLDFSDKLILQLVIVD